MKAGKLTARGLAYVLQAAGRKIRKAHREHQAPHGRQSVKQLMAHGAATSSIELTGDTKLFDRVARKWNVDYSFHKTGPDNYLLFFKSAQADAITACFSDYSRRVLGRSKARPAPIKEQVKQAAEQVRQQPRERERVKEAAREDR
ncbi:PcfB family protein [Eubacterium limosum]|uniref:PcfB family protein n=1 Tax=Eubacterium limosum TaxID=1736 RepID=UPI001559A67E